MTASDKIKKVTNGWYSMAVVSAVATLLVNGFGPFSITWAVLQTGFWFVVTWWIGKKLLDKSSLMRSVCILFSALGSILGVLAIFGLGKALFEGSAGLFDTAIEMVLAGMGISMNVKSFRMLIDKDVKRHFA